MQGAPTSKPRVALRAVRGGEAMAEAAWRKVGEVRIAPVSDGYFQTPPEMFLPAADWDAHADMVDADGLVRLPVGGFLVQTGERTILIDAGFGRPRDQTLAAAFRCGGLPDALSALGVSP